MAFRLKLVPTVTRIDFFRWWRWTFGLSAILTLIGIGSILYQGFNLGIDFTGGTAIRAESSNAIDLAQYRETLEGLPFSDATITEVFDPSFAADQHVVQIRLSSGEEDPALSADQLNEVETALKAIDPAVHFTSAESVSGKVSGELVWKAALSLIGATIGIMFYIWLRFEWQFGLGAAISLAHDAFVVVGVWSVFQLKFDLTTVAAVLTIIGYSVNDTVVVFDRVRENLMKYKQMPLVDLLNLTLNETLARTVMTSVTVLLALLALWVFGGDVIRGFVTAMLVGVLIGVYSTIYVASVVVLRLGVTRDWSKEKKADVGPYANIGN